MANPLKYRPAPNKWEHMPTDYELPEDTDWEDNWLSNSLAWASVKLGLDTWGVLHKVANPFWTDCPTCLFFRGALVGVVVTAAIAALI